ncbi:FAD-binding oxidoreductase [Pseudonocardia alni]|uniref:Glycolate oxidase n=1 Tax=Pseudonocardia alni TaxID=33907 RepID=A0AA44UT90_PSEA5|nr:FAD-binding protein [Pseudonocardia alni]PKB32941.1 glycolate oxidase [Pseudonocardia alni]
MPDRATAAVPVVVEPKGRPFGGSTAPAELDVSGPDAAGRAVLAELAAALDADRVLTDPDVVRPYVHDEAEWAEYGTPLCVVRARTTADVAATVRACAAHRVPVVARGAGTGLSGGANAVDGCVLVSLERMTAIREISAGERLAVVEPGVVNDDLRAACAEQGLWYPPDPASAPWSTIGGNVATNAGGLCCVKYGVTRDYVLALEVVTATGEVVRLGRRTAKGVVGYDLAGLMVGSEGTLGIITEITVKLRPARPAAPRTPHDDPDARDRTRAAFDEIIGAAVELGGTVTGEHGVGLLKRDGMERELGPEVLALQRAVKAALDPDGILNPGKAV